MNKNYPFAELQEKINSQQKILVYLPQNPKFDFVAAALSFSLSLQELGKEVTVICPSAMTVEFNRLVGVDKIINKAQGTDLVVSFNYAASQIEKVSYNDDGGRPNVVIQPKTNAPALSEKLVSFSYAGFGSGLIITFGIKNLGQLPKADQDLISSGEVINIDFDQVNQAFGLINLIDFEASCLSEVALGIITGLSFPLSQDTAQNVLSGIWQATAGMSKDNIGPDAFEAMAICLRAGAQKNSGVFGSAPLPSNSKSKPKFEPKEEKNPQPPPSKPPADWFEPKIFKGSSIA